MTQKNLIRVATTALTSLALLGVHAGSAAARTVHASIGNSQLGSNQAGFNYGPAGVSRSATNATGWIMPLPFENAGPKSIVVRGKAQPGGSLLCQAVALDPTTGNPASVSSISTVPITGTLQSVTLTLSNVPFGAQGSLLCTIGGSNSSTLFGVDYAP